MNEKYVKHLAVNRECDTLSISHTHTTVAAAALCACGQRY